MLEATVFNNWCYGTSYDSLSKTAINIGVFNPAGIDALLCYGDIDLTVFYIDAADKTRLLRQLNREENPNVDEIIRRFDADKEDFSDLDFEYTLLKNENIQDLLLARNTIFSLAESKWSKTLDELD